MVVSEERSPSDAERSEAFVDHIRDAATGTFELAAIAIGLALGLYQALRDGGPATSVELAARTGTAERPVREWLEHGAVNGLLDLVADADDPTARRFGLPAAHAEVLLDRDSLSYHAPTAVQVLAALHSIPLVLDSFRSGRGFAYGAAGDEMRIAEGNANRPAYLGPLGREWLPSIEDIHDRLLTDPPARIADVGCGLGWSSIGIALAYPAVSVHGVDLDEPSIAIARENATQSGVADRVTFSTVDEETLGLAGEYDLVTVFEAFHDMAHPVRILDQLRRHLAHGGCVLIVDSKTGEEFRVPGEERDGYRYGWSLLHCLHGGLLDGGTGTGTVMRPATLRAFAREAGYERVEILPIDHHSWRFYRLVP